MPEGDAWVRELEAAFAPYPEFVREVSEKIRVLNESLQAIPQETPEPSEEGAPAPAETRPEKRTENRTEVRTRAKQLPARRILLLDDAELNRVLISHYLREWPVKIEFAPTLDRALQLCSQGAYDALLVDLELQGQTPESLVAALKGVASGARLLALSSVEYSSMAEESALRFGFEHYLSRGFARQELLRRISTSLWPAS